MIIIYQCGEDVSTSGERLAVLVNVGVRPCL
jgi:hypothetical protein